MSTLACAVNKGGFYDGDLNIGLGLSLDAKLCKLRLNRCLAWKIIAIVSVKAMWRFITALRPGDNYVWKSFK